MNEWLAVVQPQDSKVPEWPLWREKARCWKLTMLHDWVSSLLSLVPLDISSSCHPTVATEIISEVITEMMISKEMLMAYQSSCSGQGKILYRSISRSISMMLEWIWARWGKIYILDTFDHSDRMDFLWVPIDSVSHHSCMLVKDSKAKQFLFHRSDIFLRSILCFTALQSARLNVLYRILSWILYNEFEVTPFMKCI